MPASMAPLSIESHLPIWPGSLLCHTSLHAVDLCPLQRAQPNVLHDHLAGEMLCMYFAIIVHGAIHLQATDRT